VADSHSANVPRRAATRRLMMVVVAMTVIAPFSIDTYLPSLPDIALEFGVSEFYLQQTLSFYLIAFAGMTLVYGTLSDTFGRRNVVMVSAAVYVATSIGCALAPNAHTLLLMRIGQGLSASGGLVVSRAIIRDSFSGAAAQRVMSRVMLMFALAPAIAPVIGGWLHELFGWRSVFWFMAGLGALVWLMVVVVLHETLPAADRHSGHPRAIVAAYGRALRQPRFMGTIAAIALAFGGLFLYIAGSPTIMYRDLGYGARDFGVLFVPVVLGLMAGALISGRMAGRYSHAQAALAGFGIMLAAAVVNVALGVWVAPTALAVIAPVAIYACGMALANPNLSLLAFEFLPRNRGLASAIQSFVQTAFAAVVAGLIVPALAGHIAWFATGMLALTGVALASWWHCRRSP
jgi:DHA1 family bicyclomycin/chloramphenicol resistance-like MFS transporter